MAVFEFTFLLGKTDATPIRITLPRFDRDLPAERARHSDEFGTDLSAVPESPTESRHAHAAQLGSSAGEPDSPGDPYPSIPASIAIGFAAIQCIRQQCSTRSASRHSRPQQVRSLNSDPSRSGRRVDESFVCRAAGFWASASLVHGWFSGRGGSGSGRWGRASCTSGKLWGDKLWAGKPWAGKCRAVKRGPARDAKSDRRETSNRGSQ